MHNLTLGDIAQLCTALAALASFIASLRNYRKIEEVHKATNSMKDELVAVTAKSSFAEGAKSEVDKARG